MPVYLVTSKQGFVKEQTAGIFLAKNSKQLFDLVDESTNPYSFKYRAVDPNSDIDVGILSTNDCVYTERHEEHFSDDHNWIEFSEEDSE